MTIAVGRIRMVSLLQPVNTRRGILVGSPQNQNRSQRQLVVAAAIKKKQIKQDYSTTMSISFVAAAAAAVVLLSPQPPVAMAAIHVQQQSEEDVTTLSNIPQMLSSRDSNNKLSRIQRPKSRKAESCTIKCVGTCIRGGDGSPGEGPLNIRRPLVVFKQGFRSRQYCLVECSDICNLIRDGDDGP